MSSAKKAIYELKHQRVNEINRRRIREVVENFYTENKEAAEIMIKQGYMNYIPDEMRSLLNKIQLIGESMESDLEKARELILEVENEAVEIEVFAKKAMKEAIEKNDREIEAIRHGSTLKKFDKQWKREVLTENKAQIKEGKLKSLEKYLVNSKIQDKDVLTDIKQELHQLKKEILEKMDKRIEEIRTHIDEAALQEEKRREAVVAIIKSLRNQEFNVEEPEVVQGKSGSYIKIKAHKPSGKEAQCRIGIQGDVIYKFDNYSGMSCLNDIDKFNVELKEIYGVDLSEEKTMWENPIRISKEAKYIQKDRVTRR